MSVSGWNLKLHKALSTVLLTCVIISQAGCGANAKDPSSLFSGGNSSPVSRDSFYFDTVCRIAVYDMEGMSEENAGAVIRDAFSLCSEYEKLLSKTLEGSDIWNINHAQGKPVECDPRTIEVIGLGIRYAELTGGAFDITIGKAVDLWDFHTEDPKVPAAEDVANAMEHVDYRMIRTEGNTVTLEDPEGEIDLGGIAKGYIADRAAEFLRQKKVTSAVISLGGNIECIGAKPNGKGSTPFRIGIEAPYSDMSKVVGVSEAENATLVTSGVYERFFVADGKEYHHILDVKTGYPADTDILGVTIRGEEGHSADCDALSTSCLILGVEKAKELIGSLDGYEALFIDRDGNLSYTDGMIFKEN